MVNHRLGRYQVYVWNVVFRTLEGHDARAKNEKRTKNETNRKVSCPFSIQVYVWRETGGIEGG